MYWRIASNPHLAYAVTKKLSHKQWRSSASRCLLIQCRTFESNQTEIYWKRYVFNKFSINQLTLGTFFIYKFEILSEVDFTDHRRTIETFRCSWKAFDFVFLWVRKNFNFLVVDKYSSLTPHEGKPQECVFVVRNAVKKKKWSKSWRKRVVQIFSPRGQTNLIAGESLRLNVNFGLHRCQVQREPLESYLSDYSPNISTKKSDTARLKR